MIAHFEDGTYKEIRPGGPTIGLRVVRWEFDSADMGELLRNPELLPILATRMPPVKDFLTGEPELESVTYPTAGCFLEEGWYSAEDLQDILKSLEDLNFGDDYA